MLRPYRFLIVSVLAIPAVIAIGDFVYAQAPQPSSVALNAIFNKVSDQRTRAENDAAQAAGQVADLEAANGALQKQVVDLQQKIADLTKPRDDAPKPETPKP